MFPRIAIPLPHSADSEYSQRAILQYEQAVQMAGGEPLRIALGLAPVAVMKIAEQCDAVLLPGSKADVDPAKFKGSRSPHTAPGDARRETIDELLLRDAYNTRKPVLGICYGLQSLNVYRGGSLLQHIPDFLPEDLRARVDHEAGGKIAVAHIVEIEPGSELARIVAPDGHGSQPQDLKGGVRGPVHLPVNSSHHQSADKIGRDLRIVARCPDDGVIEALEGADPDHFVLAVQWHPERSVDADQASRAIFRALVAAASQRSNTR